jgi:hypothetical protein
MTIKFLDVEDRPVILFSENENRRAFVWVESRWIETPALLGKILVEGITLSTDEFSREFPNADLSKFSLER